jgi:resuscitation-promoting factor RpfA
MAQRERRVGSRFRGVVRPCLLLGTTVGVLRWVVGSPADSWRALASGVSDGSGAGAAAGDVGFDHLLAGVVGLAAWAGIGWFCVIAGLQFASAAPGAVGRMCEAVSLRVTPTILRRFVEAVVGISMLAGPLTAGSALAVPTPSASSTPTPPTPNAGHWTSELDRPTSELDPPTSPSTAAPGVRLPVFLDRPANPYVAPAPPATAVVTPAGPAALIAGSPHRDIDRAGAGRGYIVHRGDALWDIAARHLGPSATAADVAREWPRWYEANRAVIGTNPSLIRPGELLVPP